MKRLFYLLLFANFQVIAQTDTIKLYFEIGKFEVSSEELRKLQVDKSDWQKVEIISYTDYLGTEKLNNRLSMDRSREVRARLVEYGLNTATLGIVEGRGIAGETLNTVEGIKTNRRTDIVISRTNPKISTNEETDTVHRKIPTVVKKVQLKSQIDSASVGDQLVLSNMLFLPGQHFLTAESLTSYNELFQTMNQNPKLRVKIEGHICCKIDNEDGLDLATNKFNLSEARAKYIYDLLIYDGIAASRLSYEGFARSNPLFPYERTEEEKTANRRVEIRILEK
ncbi:MAG: outer membrane protein OmpA-like peptidoglycan-associated protein [Vicingaceae bacterium]|jgi:outer membrane protein OmpA-like peptidoglycan-associated protein